MPAPRTDERWFIMPMQSWPEESRRTVLAGKPIGANRLVAVFDTPEEAEAAVREHNDRLNEKGPASAATDPDHGSNNPHEGNVMNAKKRTKKAAPQQGIRRTTTLHPREFPSIYALETEGACLEPEIMDGTKLLFSRDEKYRPGDLVALHIRPELVKPGEHQIIIKKLVLGVPHAFYSEPDYVYTSNIAPTVIVEMLNPRKMLYLNPASLLGIHKCLGPVPADKRTFIVTDEDVRAAAGRAA